MLLPIFSNRQAMASQIRNDAHAPTTMTITGKAHGVRTLQATKLEEGTRGGLPILFFFFPRISRARARQSDLDLRILAAVS
jgi:hypothetical protein